MDKTSEVNQNHIILGFFGFEFLPEIFTEELRLDPLVRGTKGEKYLAGSINQVEKVHDFNMWTHEIKSYSNDWIGDMIAKFIDDKISPRINTIIRLTKKL